VAALPPGAAQVAFSRDGTRAVFHDLRDDRRQVYIQDTATGAQRVIASGPEDVGFARFSRDDAWISLEISHRPKGGDDIAFMPANGGPMRVILISDQSSYSAGWMPDNDRILFAGFRDGTWNVFTVSRTTGQTERLTSYTSMRTYVRYPDWMTGDRIVYEFNETKGNIFVAGLPR
jgi:Tol biopolymer transport system component